MKNILILILIIALQSCASKTKQAHTKPILNSRESTIETKYDSTKNIYSDGVSLYVDTSLSSKVPCFSLNTNGKRHKEFFPYPGVINCLIRSSFKGNQEAVDILYEALNLVGAKGFKGSICREIRGAKLFNKLLEVIENGNNCDVDNYNTSASQYSSYALFESIKSIEGEKLSPWLRKQAYKKEFAYIWENKDLCRPIRKIQLKLIPIRKAWQEGKIILKDFGEE